MKCSVTYCSISSQRSLFLSSVVMVHDSQAYRNMEMAREPISFTFDLRDQWCNGKDKSKQMTLVRTDYKDDKRNIDDDLLLIYSTVIQ